MALFKNKFDSIRQDWNTPKPMFKQLDDEFHFEWDLAASPENALCEKFLSKDNLTQKMGRCLLA
jgi:site-specific DNA-methyltransferase (adenine-specific)